MKDEAHGSLLPHSLSLVMISAVGSFAAVWSVAAHVESYGFPFGAALMYIAPSSVSRLLLSECLDTILQRSAEKFRDVPRNVCG